MHCHYVEIVDDKTQNETQDTPLILATKHARSVDRLDLETDLDISLEIIKYLVFHGKFQYYVLIQLKCNRCFPI